jgi:hypothetical protein
MTSRIRAIRAIRGPSILDSPDSWFAESLFVVGIERAFRGHEFVEAKEGAGRDERPDDQQAENG